MKEEKTSSKTLGFSLVVAIGFTLLVVYIFLQRAGLLYFLWVAPAAYTATFVVLLWFVAESRNRLILASSIVLCALAVVAATSILTASHGYPVPYQGTVTTCTNKQIPNATSPSGFTGSTQCSNSPAANLTAFVWNLLYWLPVSGLVLFIASARQTGKNISERVGYAIIGLVLLVALLLPLVGIPSIGL